VRAAAKLAGGADVEHADLVAVLFAEQHHRAELLRFVDRHDARVGRMVVEDLALTISSTRRIWSSVIGALCAKSKRVLSGSTSEPFCCT
jgi:hypothetical protein